MDSSYEEGATAMQRNLLSILSKETKTFSKGQKRIAKYLTENYDKAAFMTAAVLGKTVGTSESTVVRFAAALGYEGYPELQKALQELVRTRLTSVQRMEVAKQRLSEKDLLDTVLTQDIEKIRLTMEETSHEAFVRAVKTILSAKTIYINGARSSSGLGQFLAFYFNQIFDHVILLNTSGANEMVEQLFRIGPEDVLIGISFPRYSKQTVRAIRYAKQSGAAIVAITDSDESPIARLADQVLLARSDMASFVDSLVAPLSLINALIVAVSREKSEEVSRTYSRLEQIWDTYDVYEKQSEEE